MTAESNLVRPRSGRTPRSSFSWLPSPIQGCQQCQCHVDHSEFGGNQLAVVPLARRRRVSPTRSTNPAKRVRAWVGNRLFRADPIPRRRAVRAPRHPTGQPPCLDSTRPDAVRCHQTRLFRNHPSRCRIAAHDRLGRRSLLPRRRAWGLRPGRRRAPRGEPLHRAATHRPAKQRLVAWPTERPSARGSGRRLPCEWHHRGRRRP